MKKILSLKEFLREFATEFKDSRFGRKFNIDGEGIVFGVCNIPLESNVAKGCADGKSIIISREALTALKEFEKNKESMDTDTVIVVTGPKIDSSMAREIFLSSACYNFYELNKDFYDKNGLEYFGPLSALELGYSFKADYVRISDISEVVLEVDNRDWLDREGRIWYRGIGLSKHASVLDYIIDMYNITMVYPEVDLTVEIYKSGEVIYGEPPLYSFSGTGCSKHVEVPVAKIRCCNKTIKVTGPSDCAKVFVG